MLRCIRRCSAKKRKWRGFMYRATTGPFIQAGLGCDGSRRKPKSRSVAAVDALPLESLRASCGNASPNEGEDVDERSDVDDCDNKSS